VFAIVVIAQIVLSALALNINQDQIYRAIDIARGSKTDLAAFHKPYIHEFNDATVEVIEVRTEFRRVVLEAQERLRMGDHVWGANNAVVFLKPFRETVTLAARLRFHPQNVLVTMPETQIALGPIVSIADRQTPLFLQGQKKGAPSPIVGGIVEADFDAHAVGQQTWAASVMMNGHELVHASFDFSKLQ
jgi:hypothetical protein